MNRAMRLQEFLLCRGGGSTLGEIIEDGHQSIKYKVTAAVSDLRKQLKPFNKTVVFYKGSTPSKNRYVIEKISEPMPKPDRVQADVSLSCIPSAPHISNRHQNQLPL